MPSAMPIEYCVWGTRLGFTGLSITGLMITDLIITAHNRRPHMFESWHPQVFSRLCEDTVHEPLNICIGDAVYDTRM